MLQDSLKRHLGVLGALTVLALTSDAYAQTYTESSDVPGTLAGAQALPAGTTQIDGTLNPSGDVDMWQLDFNVTTTLTIFSAENGTIDPNMILITAAGIPVYGDDDGGGGLDSRIIYGIAPGTYYLAYGANNIDAYDASNIAICSNGQNGPCATSSAVAYISSTVGSGTGPYTITLSAATSGAVDLAVSPSSQTFAATVVGGTSPEISFTVSNTGSAQANGLAASLTGADAGMYTITGGTCGSTLAGNSSCTVTVAFTPTGAISAATSTFAMLDVVSDESSVSVALRGLTGATTAQIPTLSEWGMIVFAGLLLITMLVAMQRKQDEPRA